MIGRAMDNRVTRAQLTALEIVELKCDVHSMRFCAELDRRDGISMGLVKGYRSPRFREHIVGTWLNLNDFFIGLIISYSFKSPQNNRLTQGGKHLDYLKSI